MLIVCVLWPLTFVLSPRLLVVVRCVVVPVSIGIILTRRRKPVCKQLANSNSFPVLSSFSSTVTPSILADNYLITLLLLFKGTWNTTNVQLRQFKCVHAHLQLKLHTTILHTLIGCYYQLHPKWTEREYTCTSCTGGVYYYIQSSPFNVNVSTWPLSQAIWNCPL